MNRMHRFYFQCRIQLFRTHMIIRCHCMMPHTKQDAKKTRARLSISPRLSWLFCRGSVRA